MKTTFTLLAALCCFGPAKAQNFYGDFENWRTISSGLPPTSIEIPQKWFGADSLIFYYQPLLPGVTPAVCMSKDGDAHSGSYAVKLVSKDMGAAVGVLPGLLSNAKPDVDINNFDINDIVGSLKLVGGTAVSERLDKVRAWIKHLPQGNDNGLVIVNAISTQGGQDVLVGQGFLIIDQTYSSYTQIEVPIGYSNQTVVPSKLQIAFFSSNLAAVTKGTQGTSTPTNGSTLLIDDVEAVNTLDVTEQAAIEKLVKLFPNPAKQELRILPVSSGKLIWTAYDMAGRIVMQEQIQGATSINVDPLSNGLYFYRLFDEKGALQQKGKFQVQR